MPNDTLVVPVEVAAFAVNPQTRDSDGSYVMLRWTANFRNLTSDNAAPEPAPFVVTEDWTMNPESRLGVYLQWQLPEALCRGHQDEESGEIGDFPLVPNRWLVVRRSSRGMRSWIVHSDYIGADGDGVSYLDPHAASATATVVGRRVDLTPGSPWQEPGGGLFLTAIGPGLLTFAVFQPYNKNVFSIHDTLEDVDGADRLSYWVAGWYSDPGSDILAADTPFADLMDRLEWSLAPAFGSPRRSVFTGSALGIDWQPDGPPYPSACPPRGGDIAVAIGNSTAEAAAVLQERAGGPDCLTAGEARLYSAFTLGVLDSCDGPDGDLFISRAAHDQGFGPVPGGYSWRLVDHDDDAALGARPPAGLAGERVLAADVLAGLNRGQRELDDLERALAGARQRLYVLWALNQEKDPPPPGFFAQAIRAELDPANPDGAAGIAARLEAEVAARRGEPGQEHPDAVPWAATEAELAARARGYAASHGLRSALELKRVPDEPFDQHVDPVLMLAGAGLNAPLTRGSALPCRVEERLVTAIGPITAGTVSGDAGQVNVTGLPGPMHALVTEFCIIDQASKTGTPLSGATGTLPEYGTQPWRQPWQPLYLLWRAEYTAIPVTRGWSFDGTRYRWDGDGREELKPAVTVSGRQVLTPTSGYDQEGKLDSYANGRADLPGPLLSGLRGLLSELDQLSQRLDGLSAAVGQRLSRISRAPAGALGDLIADGAGLVPDPGPQPVDEWDRWEPSRFQELRSGQLAFTNIAVVDRFGRAVNLFESGQHFDWLIKPESMTPDEPVGVVQPDRYVELGPRLLQPARLRFDFLSAGKESADEDVQLTAGANPVGAWLVHNRLDRSIACYDPSGQALGDLRAVLTDDRERIVTWTALPGSPVQLLDQLADISPPAWDFLAAIVDGGPAVLAALRAQIDATLIAIDPGGPEDQSLAFLLGRPLALVRARLDLQLCGPPRADVSWQKVLSPDPPQLPGYQWNVRLGEARQVDDGLIGYVLGEDYAHLETVVDPVDPGHGGYLRAIGNADRLKLAFEGTNTATVTLLMDPRAAVHAITDILPSSSVYVPQQYTDSALAAMAVNFRAGPLLIATTGDGAATLPQPATATGTWSWTEPDGAGWNQLPITPPDPASLPVGQDPEVRSGYLVLENAVEHSRRASNEQGAR
jgi:hypothetical protein